jgi:ubiquinone/menaquinone biosynthesis C-methylase UbiE
MDARNHWERVYTAKASEAVSWYAAHLQESSSYIKRTGLSTAATVIDVGGGEARLVDDLLEAGYGDVTVLDISTMALEVCRQRLGPRADRVNWLADDFLTHEFPSHSLDVWHDRAVFRFLTSDEQRRTYVRQVARALRPDGFAIVGTFGPHGSEQCSGLSVMRSASTELHGTFGARFRLVDSRIDVHATPWGLPQEFGYCFCRREQ